MVEVNVEKVPALAPHLLEMAHRKIWVDYDEVADVFYVNFKKILPSVEFTRAHKVILYVKQENLPFGRIYSSTQSYTLCTTRSQSQLTMPNSPTTS